MLLPKMEEHCIKLTGIGLAEYSAKRLAEDREEAAHQTAQPMKTPAKKQWEGAMR